MKPRCGLDGSSARTSASRSRGGLACVQRPVSPRARRHAGRRVRSARARAKKAATPNSFVRHSSVRRSWSSALSTSHLRATMKRRNAAVSSPATTRSGGSDLAAQRVSVTATPALACSAAPDARSKLLEQLCLVAHRPCDAGRLAGCHREREARTRRRRGARWDRCGSQAGPTSSSSFQRARRNRRRWSCIPRERWQPTLLHVLRAPLRATNALGAPSAGAPS